MQKKCNSGFSLVPFYKFGLWRLAVWMVYILAPLLIIGVAVHLQDMQSKGLSVHSGG